jgi:hypothetical protein
MKVASHGGEESRCGRPTLRQVLQLSSLRSLDPRSDRARAAALANAGPDAKRPINELLEVEICAAVFGFAPDTDPWTWELERVAVAVAQRVSA